MKTKIYALLLGMLCLCTMAISQTVSPALSGFNGKIQFQGFANNGLFIRGTLGEFLDQTNQYFASDIDTNDVAWDNLGRKYRVVAVISSNLTQAVVDMARVGGGTHFPSGVGMVNRETANGLSLVATANSIGISQQLLSRILTNNFEVMGGLKTIYTGSDSVRVPTILVKFATSQSVGIGNFADVRYPNYSTDFGLNISLNENGYIGLHNRLSYIEARNDLVSMFGSDGNAFGNTGVRGFSNGNAISYSDVGSSSFLTYGRNLTEIKTAIGGGQFPHIANINSAVYEVPSSTYGTQSVSVNISTPSRKTALVNYSELGDTLYYNYMGNGDSVEVDLGGSIASGRFSGFNPSGVKLYKIGYYRRSTNTQLAELFKVDFLSTHSVSMYGKYSFANATPSATSGAKTIHLLTGDGTTTNPSLLRFQNGVTTASTDGSGDLSTTVPTMPDATYSVNITVEGTTSYTVSVHTKTTTSFKVRFFNPATGAAVASTAVSYSYKIEDY